MTEAQRHQILLELLAQTGFITVEKVIERLGISPATARRDINKLDESGKLKKVRNGAEAISQQRPRWTPMNIHQAQNHDEKVRIARAASQLVNPGESVVIPAICCCQRLFATAATGVRQMPAAHRFSGGSSACRARNGRKRAFSAKVRMLSSHSV